MTEYEKINTLWKREEVRGKNIGKVIEGEYTKEEYELIDRWEVTEKIDGQCITILITKDDIKIYGKSEKTEFNKSHIPLLAYINNKITGNVVNSIFDFDKASIITLYGEGYGAKIQKGGGNYSDEQKFILFDINIDGIWLESEKVKEFADLMNLDMVPMLGIMTKAEVVEYVKSNKHSTFGDFPMEGVVCRSKPLLLDRMGRRLTFKLKARDFK